MAPDHSGRHSATWELLYRSGRHRDQKFKFPRWGGGPGTWESTLQSTYLMMGYELEAVQHTILFWVMSCITFGSFGFVLDQE